MRLFWLSLLLIPVFYISAQAIDPSSVTDRRAQLESELAGIEKEIGGYRNIIQDKQNQAQSLERDIALLDAQIKKSQLEIRARNIAISNLQGAIGEKNKTISALDNKIEREKDSLSELLRELYQIDQSSMVEMLLGYDNLSEFFVQADSFDAIQRSLQQSFQEIRANKSEAEAQKIDLEERKVLDERAKNAAAIRSQLFLLNGSKAIPFEKALEYALQVEKGAGIRPAFLLGIIAEESNLGANVGTGNWNIDLAHARCAKQRDAFKDITSRLGLNPDSMPVSKKAWYG